ncbi:unnamed protein product [Bemisia tabaci]|uniref:Major facilitator superfamily (MFS) profile domain-containing protein n=1 Tax=Bemisia tabaci TaxID=7038 RepID=A0A9P0EW39_BEMTA|nr:unnamed protein product [Bemisia tabaci]
MTDTVVPSRGSDVQHGKSTSNHQTKSSYRSGFAQILVALIQSCLIFDHGLEMGIPILVIGALHRNSSEALNMNDDQASWFGSILNIVHPVASLTSGFFQEKLGRKGSMISTTIPLFGAWMTLYFAQSVYALYAVVLIFGLCRGLTEAPLHAYTGEIGEPLLRGTMSTISVSAAIIGASVVFALNYFFNWRSVALICSAFPIVTFALLTQIPESPTWLISKNRLDDAMKSLCWLRGWVEPNKVETEFKNLVNYVRNSTEQNESSSNGSDQTKKDGFFAKGTRYLATNYKIMTSRKVLRPLRLVFIVVVVSLTAFLAGIRPYFIREIQELKSPIDARLILVSSTGSLFIGAIMNVAFLRRFGKRKIALFSHAVAACCIFGMGAYSSFLRDAGSYVQLRWIPIIFWLLLNVVCGLSISVLPWQLICEVFPVAGRGLAVGISAAWAHVVMGLMVKFYIYTEAWLGFSWMMYLHGAGTLIGLTYYFFYFPETEGKSLEQIEQYFAGNYNREENNSIDRRMKY